MPQSVRNVAVVGIGSMGRAAVELLQQHLCVYVYDVDETKRSELQTEGLTVCTTLRDVVESAEIVLLFLPGPREVEESITGADGLAAEIRPGTVIVDMSTVDPNTTRDMYQAVLDKKGHYLDAPVLGRPDKAGSWTLPVGGNKEPLDKVAAVLNVLSTRVIHVGSSGSGNVIKLLNNLMFGAINNVTAEVLSAASRLGVSPRVVYDTIAESGAATVSNLFKSIGPKIVDAEFSPVFRVELLYKDMELGLKMAKSAGATLIVSEGAQKLTEMAIAKGYEGQDSSIVTRITDLISAGDLCVKRNNREAIHEN